MARGLGVKFKKIGVEERVLADGLMVLKACELHRWILESGPSGEKGGRVSLGLLLPSVRSYSTLVYSDPPRRDGHGRQHIYSYPTNRPAIDKSPAFASAAFEEIGAGLSVPFGDDPKTPTQPSVIVNPYRK